MDENRQQTIDNIADIASRLGDTFANVYSAINKGRQNSASSKDVSFSGSYSDSNSTPPWLLPVGVGIACLASLFLIFKR